MEVRLAQGSTGKYTRREAVQPIRSLRGNRPIQALALSGFDRTQPVRVGARATLLAFASLALLQGAPALAAVPPRPEAVRTVAQDQRGATFEITPGDAKFDVVSVNGTAYTRVGLAGAVVLESPGRPSLPSLTLQVAIPDGMSPRL